jgi:hypothetical protein
MCARGAEDVLVHELCIILVKDFRNVKIVRCTNLQGIDFSLATDSRRITSRIKACWCLAVNAGVRTYEL